MLMYVEWKKIGADGNFNHAAITHFGQYAI